MLNQKGIVYMELSLTKNVKFKGRNAPLLLIIMDGVGLGPKDETNAVYMANTPVLDKLFKMPLFCSLKAHGKSVGLPTDDDMGNSEVGHNALGAGRVFEQGASLVNTAMNTGKIFKGDIWKHISERSLSGGTLHFIGLLSDGNVHSNIEHLFIFLNHCADQKFKKVMVHVLLDGRDVGEKSALDYVIPTEKLLKDLSVRTGGDYRIASGGGRMKVTMDRYNADWSIVERGWNAHVLANGRRFRSAEEAVKTMYSEDHHITDQYLDSFVIEDSNGHPAGPICDGDSVVFFNFRGDRAIEISRAFTEENFNEFNRGKLPDILYAGIMEYDGDTHLPPLFLVAHPEIDKTICEYLCQAGIPSFAVSETQKFGHVTYFWNGNRSGYINSSLEYYLEIPSDRVEFDKTPAMKAFEITSAVEELLRSGKYCFGRLNFPNGDMVGHTGVMDATVHAIEAVDTCVGKLLDIMKELGGITVVTADHGNSDIMFKINKQGEKEPVTSHTLMPVPFVIVDPQYSGEYQMVCHDNAGISNIASTLLCLLGFNPPEIYDEPLVKVV